jgi:hypothetical protein
MILHSRLVTMIGEFQHTITRQRDAWASEDRLLIPSLNRIAKAASYPTVEAYAANALSRLLPADR